MCRPNCPCKTFMPDVNCAFWQIVAYNIGLQFYADMTEIVEAAML